MVDKFNIIGTCVVELVQVFKKTTRARVNKSKPHKIAELESRVLFAIDRASNIEWKVIGKKVELRVETSPIAYEATYAYYIITLAPANDTQTYILKTILRSKLVEPGNIEAKERKLIRQYAAKHIQAIRALKAVTNGRSLSMFSEVKLSKILAKYIPNY